MLWMCNVLYDMMLEYYKNGIADPVDPPGDDDDDDNDIHAGVVLVVPTRSQQSNKARDGCRF